MDERPLDPERLKELVGEIASAGEEVEFIHDIDASGHAPKSMEEIAAAAVAEIEKNTGPRRKYSTDDGPGSVHVRHSRTSWYVLALALAVAAGVWFKAFRKAPLPLPGDPVDLVAVLSPKAIATPGLAPEWSVTRGVSDSLSERGRAVRIGSLLFEFERASVRGDSAAQQYADAVAALLVDQPEGAEVAAVFAAGGESARLPDARHALAPLARAAPMAVGGWLQAARVAAVAGDAGFFASVKSRESMVLLLAMPAMTSEVEAARDRLDTLLHRRGRPEFAVVADALELLQREMAN